MSHLIKIYAVSKFSYVRLWCLKSIALNVSLSVQRSRCRVVFIHGVHGDHLTNHAVDRSVTMATMELPIIVLRPVQ